VHVPHSASVTSRRTVATRAPAAGVPQRIDQRAVVGAVARRLDDDVACEAEPVAQREQLLREASQGVYLRSGA